MKLALAMLFVVVTASTARAEFCVGYQCAAGRAGWHLHGCYAVDTSQVSHCPAESRVECWDAEDGTCARVGNEVDGGQCTADSSNDLCDADLNLTLEEQNLESQQASDAERQSEIDQQEQQDQARDAEIDQQMQEDQQRQQQQQEEQLQQQEEQRQEQEQEEEQAREAQAEQEREAEAEREREAQEAQAQEQEREAEAAAQAQEQQQEAQDQRDETASELNDTGAELAQDAAERTADESALSDAGLDAMKTSVEDDADEQADASARAQLSSVMGSDTTPASSGWNTPICVTPPCNAGSGATEVHFTNDQIAAAPVVQTQAALPEPPPAEPSPPPPVDQPAPVKPASSVIERAPEPEQPQQALSGIAKLVQDQQGVNSELVRNAAASREAAQNAVWPWSDANDLDATGYEVAAKVHQAVVVQPLQSAQAAYDKVAGAVQAVGDTAAGQMVQRAAQDILDFGVSLQPKPKQDDE